MEIGYKSIFAQRFMESQHDYARLRLALLKENFSYRGFYEELKSDPYGVISELRNPDETRERYFDKLFSLEVQGIPLFASRAQEFGVNERFLVDLQLSGGIRTDEILALLDPNWDISDISSPALVKLLPLLFLSFGIREFGQPQGVEIGPDGEPVYRRFETSMEDAVHPYEKVIRIDLRKRKSQLMEEFEHYLDWQIEVRRAGVQLKKQNSTSGIYQISGMLSDWEPQNSRFRKEAWEHLEVWKLRKQRKNFWVISRSLKISEDSAKKRFYRAYELTQGQPYDSERYMKIAWHPKKSDLLKTCDTCADEKCLKNLHMGIEWHPCPEVLSYIEQDQVALQELLENPKP